MSDASAGGRPTLPESVVLAKFPYPYEAAATVSSDTDEASYSRFDAIHALLCGRDVIRPGTENWKTLGLTEKSRWYDAEAGGVRGLGLDFSDSFFLIGDDITMGMYRFDPATGGFHEDESDGHNAAQAIKGWLKRGDIEAFHAFLHYRRDQVLPLLKGLYVWCDREGVAKPKVWINHSLAVCPTGLCPRRFRASLAVAIFRRTARWLVGPLFGRKRMPIRHAWAWYWGATPGTPYYVNDVLTANGLRYVWLNLGPEKDTFVNRIALPERTWNGRQSILDTVTMDDGVRYFRFARCYGGTRAMPDGVVGLRDGENVLDASAVFTRENLDRLCAEEGTCILCTHWTAVPSFPIQDETIGRFRLLREYRDGGRIWVTTLARLLEWTRFRTFLRHESRLNGDRLDIDIQATDDPVLGSQVVSGDQCEGLVFRIPPSVREVRIGIAGRPLAPDAVHRDAGRCWIRASGANGRG